MKIIAPCYLLVVICCVSCHFTKEANQDASILMDTDIRFSRLSEESGMKKAFLAYADSNVIILRNGNPPIKGIQALKTYYDHIDDASFKLTWEPVRAERSGYLGYTYGNFELTVFDNDSTATKSFGNYVTIWKKQPDNQWRFVLDTGTKPAEEPLE